MHLFPVLFSLSTLESGIGLRRALQRYRCAAPQRKTGFLAMQLKKSRGTTAIMAVERCSGWAPPGVPDSFGAETRRAIRGHRPTASSPRASAKLIWHSVLCPRPRCRRWSHSGRCGSTCRVRTPRSGRTTRRHSDGGRRPPATPACDTRRSCRTHTRAALSSHSEAPRRCGNARGGRFHSEKNNFRCGAPHRYLCYGPHNAEDTLDSSRRVGNSSKPDDACGLGTGWRVRGRGAERLVATQQAA